MNKRNVQKRIATILIISFIARAVSSGMLVNDKNSAILAADSEQLSQSKVEETLNTMGVDELYSHLKSLRGIVAQLECSSLFIQKSVCPSLQKAFLNDQEQAIKVQQEAEKMMINWDADIKNLDNAILKAFSGAQDNAVKWQNEIRKELGAVKEALQAVAICVQNTHATLQTKLESGDKKVSQQVIRNTVINIKKIENKLLLFNEKLNRYKSEVETNMQQFNKNQDELARLSTSNKEANQFLNEKLLAIQQQIKVERRNIEGNKLWSIISLTGGSVLFVGGALGLVALSLGTGGATSPLLGYWFAAGASGLIGLGGSATGIAGTAFDAFSPSLKQKIRDYEEESQKLEKDKSYLQKALDVVNIVKEQHTKLYQAVDLASSALEDLRNEFSVIQGKYEATRICLAVSNTTVLKLIAKKMKVVNQSWQDISNLCQRFFIDIKDNVQNNK